MSAGHKSVYYFAHDFHARHDIKIQNLIWKKGMEAVGIYWCLTEILHEENGFALLSHCDGIALGMLVKPEAILSVIKDFDLFENDGTKFWSKRVLENIKIREEKSSAARTSAVSRWDRNADAMRTHSERNALKERKGKKIKDIGNFHSSVDKPVDKSRVNKWKALKWTDLHIKEQLLMEGYTEKSIDQALGKEF